MGGLDVVDVIESTFDEALKALKSDDTRGFVQRLASKELWDYTPLDDTLRQITNIVHARMAEKQEGTSGNKAEHWTCRVQVIPRGSFVTKTAIRGHTDLDVDLVIPDDFPFPDPNGKQTIKDFLGGVDPTSERLVFDSVKLKAALQTIWSILRDPEAGNQTSKLATTNFLELRRDAKDFTRSIDARTVHVFPGLMDGPAEKNAMVDDSQKQTGNAINAEANSADGKPKVGVPGQLEVDIFIKIKIKTSGGSVIIVGVEKDGPDRLRRYQETDYLPVEGKWLGDRVLHPVDRCALLMLKWWKTAKKLPIKSHHLLTALNALHELDPFKDNHNLYLPSKTSGRLSNVAVMEVMRGILIYLRSAYMSKCNFLLRRTVDGKTVTDYPFPQVRCSH
jgi:hypothetical protein